MEDFFDTLYYYTSNLYGKELDNYLYDTVHGYLHVGLVMLISSAIICALFYYMLKPVRHQLVTWFGCVGLDAFLNFLVALWYTNTPLINNEIDESDSWSILDTFGFGFANIIWAFAACVVISLLIKWWSPAKYVPFKKF